MNEIKHLRSLVSAMRSEARKLKREAEVLHARAAQQEEAAQALDLELDRLEQRQGLQAGVSRG